MNWDIEWERANKDKRNTRKRELYKLNSEHRRAVNRDGYHRRKAKDEQETIRQPGITIHRIL